MFTSVNPVNLDRDFDYAIQPTRLFLLPLGLWPAKSKLYQSYLRPAAITISLLVMSFTIIPMCLLVILLANDLKARIKLIGPLCFALMTFLKFLLMIYKHAKIIECVGNMSVSWRHVKHESEQHKIMLENVKTARRLAIASAVLTYLSGMLYVTVLPLSTASVQCANQSLITLSYPSYFVFFYPQVRSIYDFVFAVNCMCGMIECTLICGIYSLVILLVMHICSQITITRQMMDNLVENFDHKLLGDIVSQHTRLLKLATKLEEIFNKICFIEVFGGTCVICFLGCYLIAEDDKKSTFAFVTYSLVLLSFVFNIFILCYIGEILTEQCESIGQAAYMTDWYRLSQREATNFVLLIMTRQCPVYLTAGKLFNLSILNFSNLIKAAASYLEILRSIIAIL